MYSSSQAMLKLSQSARGHVVTLTLIWIELLPVLHGHILYARDHLTYKDCMNVPFVSLSVIINFITTLVIYHHHDLHGHYHMRAFIPLPPLASNIIGLLPVQSQKSIVEKSRSISIGMRPISSLFPIFRRTVARRK